VANVTFWLDWKSGCMRATPVNMFWPAKGDTQPTEFDSKTMDDGCGGSGLRPMKTYEVDRFAGSRTNL
jgi:hypothetical protein